MTTHSNVLAWEIPWTEEPRGLQSMGSQRIRYDWSDLAHTQTHIHTHTHTCIASSLNMKFPLYYNFTKVPNTEINKINPRSLHLLERSQTSYSEHCKFSFGSISPLTTPHRQNRRPGVNVKFIKQTNKPLCLALPSLLPISPWSEGWYAFRPRLDQREGCMCVLWNLSRKETDLESCF